MDEAKKAVVVDDDPKVLMLLEKGLNRIGFQVFMAEEGNKALELLKKEKPQLLITDILQPGLDGVKLCKEVKADPDLEDIKIIVVTGVYNEASFRLEMGFKVDGFIEKPVDIAKLEKMVGDEISNWGA